MKRFERYLIDTALVVFLLLTNGIAASGQDSSSVKAADSLEVSLLTCGPRPNVYSLYGHTAIRFRDKAHGTDLAVNYGMFSFDKPFFILRFVFGLTDYEMGIEYFSDFVSHYSASGCGVRQQVLNLTGEEKLAIAAAIDENFRPENRVYRYNYFYDNCTTRARDILLSHVRGEVKYAGNVDPNESFRQMIHRYNNTHRWARFGNDLLLGVQADLPTDRSEHQFLPDNLANDFAGAVVTSDDGSSRKLVSEDFWIVPRMGDVGSDSFPLTPMECMCIVAAVVLLATVLEWRRGISLWAVDAVMMVVTGLCGVILLAMVFSQHPTVRLNLQILLLNPLMLVAVVPVVKRMRAHRPSRWLEFWTACIILFAVGGIFQTYAEGMYVVALSLLLRNIYKIYTLRKK